MALVTRHLEWWSFLRGFTFATPCRRLTWLCKLSGSHTSRRSMTLICWAIVIARHLLVSRARSCDDGSCPHNAERDLAYHFAHIGHVASLVVTSGGYRSHSSELGTKRNLVCVIRSSVRLIASTWNRRPCSSSSKPGSLATSV